MRFVNSLFNGINDGKEQKIQSKKFVAAGGLLSNKTFK
jgi:hypothetical protein